MTIERAFGCVFFTDGCDYVVTVDGIEVCRDWNKRDVYAVFVAEVRRRAGK